MGAKSRESCSSSDEQPEATTSITQSNMAVKRSTVALYSDELRLSIIEEVFKRPILWDNSNREPASLLLRKEFYEEIAESLKSIDQTLNAAIVEKQWKNLKDTYNKVKKKKTLDENGLVITPKWRFYNHMLFIDHDVAGEPTCQTNNRKRVEKMPDNNNEYNIPNKMLRPQSRDDLSEEEYDSFYMVFIHQEKAFWVVQYGKLKKERVCKRCVPPFLSFDIASVEKLVEPLLNAAFAWQFRTNRQTKITTKAAFNHDRTAEFPVFDNTEYFFLMGEDLI